MQPVLCGVEGYLHAPHGIQDIPNNQIWEKSDHVQRENKEDEVCA